MKNRAVSVRADGEREGGEGETGSSSSSFQAPAPLPPSLPHFCNRPPPFLFPPIRVFFPRPPLSPLLFPNLLPR